MKRSRGFSIYLVGRAKWIWKYGWSGLWGKKKNQMAPNLGAWVNLVDGFTVKYVLKICIEHVLCGGHFFGKIYFSNF